ncbi:MAG: N-formylglutamate amidohydrolase [Flavobacteriales bacterium]|nr:N-formylglutamate amidohydrolase [Flavobacteriales bacterium]
MKLLLTCEHGGNQVPKAYRDVFATAERELKSHRGWDPGALSLYRALLPISDASYHCTVTRLLVELNRSARHPRLFSAWSRRLDAHQRNEVRARYYDPFREDVLRTVTGWARSGQEVLHISVHSFTPILDGQVRDMHVGLLYDPAHGRESELAARWKLLLQATAPDLIVRRNAPYKGTSDGHTRALRQAVGPNYHGIELEVRNDLLADPIATERMARVLMPTLAVLSGKA